MNIEKYVDVGNVKFRSGHRDSMYFVLRDKDDSKLFSSIPSIFYTAFAIGYHFDRFSDIPPKAINHINLVSMDREIKELMVILMLKRFQDMDPKDLWKKVEMYAEYGIEVLFNHWKENKNSIILDQLI